MKILVAIPSSRFYQPFWESLSFFLIEAKKKYEIEVNVVRDKKIAEARTDLVNSFLSGNADYILFLDDDHEGHTVDMLDALVNRNDYVCAIKCLSRFFPYLPNILFYSGESNPHMKYELRDMGSGMHEHDLVGFGMTLIRRDTFSKIEKPYFVSDEGLNCHEDNYFCDKLQSKGIKPIGCFDFCLPHQGIDEKKADELREVGILEIKDTISREHPGIDLSNMVLVT